MRDYFKKVYETAAKIPRGKVATYGQIALMLGNPRGARTVGWAMQATPKELNIPCHRVVNKTGRLAPYYVFGSSENQRALLEAEGIEFLDNGCIDMEKYSWTGEECE